jgi:hypothetical protein
MEFVVALAILLPMIALVVVILLVARRMGVRAKALRIEREKLEAVAAGHRQMAEAHERERL